MTTETPEIKRILKVIQIMKRLAERSFYGKLTASWEAGRIVNVKVEESYKIEE
jgi:hypothetical protein